MNKRYHKITTDNSNYVMLKSRYISALSPRLSIYKEVIPSLRLAQDRYRHRRVGALPLVA